MSYQSFAPGPVERGAPAAYWYPVNNPSAPRVGWFVDDGSCHGNQACGYDAIVFDKARAATGGGHFESAVPKNEGDVGVVEPELPAGSPSPPAGEEAWPVRATLKDKSNDITTASRVGSTTRVPVSGRDSKDARNKSRDIALPTQDDENVGVTASPSLWVRFATTPSILDERTQEPPREAQRAEHKWLLDASDDTADTAGQIFEDNPAIEHADIVEDRPMSPFTLPPPMIQEPKIEPERIVQGTFADILESLPPTKSAFDDWSDDDDYECDPHEYM